MTQIDASPAPTQVVRHRPPPWVRGWQAGAAVLLVGWIAVAALWLFTGVSEASGWALREDVAAGRVAEVSTLRGASTDGGSVWVQWRTGPTSAYSATVRAEVLRGLQDHAGVEVEPTARPSGSARMLGREVPGNHPFVYLGLVVGSITVLALSPWTHRATPWAWTWATLLLPPFGPLAWLVLGGAFSPRPHRAPVVAVTVTGGWAFVLCLVLRQVVEG